MNSSKQMFAIVAVLAMLGAALVGVGYAFTAQTDNTDNTSLTDFYLVAANTRAGPTAVATAYEGEFQNPVGYDTVVVPAADSKYDITYTLNPDVTGTASSSYKGVGVTVLGQFPVNISQPVPNADTPPTSRVSPGNPTDNTLKYAIQVSIPASAIPATAQGGVDPDNLDFYAQAVQTVWKSDSTEESTVGFDKDANNVVKMYLHDGIYEAYLPVTSGVQATNTTSTEGGDDYTVFIGVASKTASFTDSAQSALPIVKKTVMDDAAITVKVDSKSLYDTDDATKTVTVFGAALAASKVKVTIDSTAAQTISISKFFESFGGKELTKANALAAETYVWTFTAGSTNATFDDSTETITIPTDAVAGTITLTIKAAGTGWTTGDEKTATIEIVLV